MKKEFFAGRRGVMQASEQLGQRQADRRGTKARVATLRAYGAVDVTVDRGAWIHPMIVQALDADGQPVDNELINFVVQDYHGETGFIAEGIDFPIEHSLGITDSNGFCAPFEIVRAGQVPESVVVKATVASSEGVSADFRAKISDQVPSEIRLLSGGDSSWKGGQAVIVSFVVQVFGAQDEPIGYGALRFEIYDPEGTGSELLFGSFPAAYVVEPVDAEGRVSFECVLWVGDEAPGKPFFIRVSRDGRHPTKDVRFTAE